MSKHYLLDASAILALLTTDIHSQAITNWFECIETAPIVSDFAAAEFAAVISRRVRTDVVNAAEASSILTEFDHWRASSALHRLTSPADIAACERLIRRFELKLLAPDALHIAMALADGATLVTFDERQAQAMRQLGDCVVPA